MWRAINSPLRRWTVASAVLTALAGLLSAGTALGQPSYLLFESGPVRPIATSPDGTRLFAVNTPDGYLEIFDVAGDGSLVRSSSVRVGMEPVAVVEAGEPVTEPFGDRRFRRLVQGMGPVAAAHIPNRILHEVETFLEGQAIHDDVTLVAFELVGDGASRL